MRGRWWVQFASERVPVESRRAAFDDAETATAWAAAVVEAVAAGVAPPSPGLFARRLEGPFSAEELRRTPIVRAFEEWHRHHFEVQLRARPVRSKAVWVNACNHVFPFLHSLGVVYLQDLQPGHVLELSLALAGRSTRQGPATDTAHAGSGSAEVDWDELLTVAQVVELSRSDPALRPLSESTVRRALAGLTLRAQPGGSGTQRFTRRDLHRAKLLRPVVSPAGLNVSTANDILTSLRLSVEFAQAMRAQGVDRFAPLVWRSTPPLGKDQARGRRLHSKALSWADARAMAAEMTVVHQFALWLVLVTGLRAGELFGLKVHDWMDARDRHWPYPTQDGVGGLLRVERQGGRRITSRDDFTGQVTTGSTGPTKTAQSMRVVVVPELLAELIRVVVQVFHTDPDSGELAAQSRLIPVLNSETGGQGTFSNALTRALAVWNCRSPHRTTFVAAW